MFVATEDGRLYVHSAGSGEPLLLIHGWPLDHRVFGPQQEMLAEHFRVLAYDRRGFGRSTAPPGLDRELDDIDRILDAAGAPSAHLLGMSQGGRIALRYAATRPQRTRSLILQGAAVDGLPTEGDDDVPVAEYAELVRAGRVDEVRARWLAHPMMQLGPGNEAAARLLTEILEDYDGTDLQHLAPGGYGFDKDVLASIAAHGIPTLVLTGGRETAARKRHAHVIAERIPNAVEITLEQSGHMSNLTEPARYNSSVIAFCRGIDERG
jgi:pimeloyl-ACP methyl ester carboxylesterase